LKIDQYGFKLKEMINKHMDESKPPVDLFLYKMLLDKSRFEQSIANIFFKNCSMNEAKFTDISLDHVIFEYCDMRGTVFNDVSFVSCKFHSCKMEKARFNGGFDRSSFTYCNLSDADLRSTALNTGTSFACCDGIINAGHCHNYPVLGYTHKGILRIRGGCHDFSLKEAFKYWDQEDKNKKGSQENRTEIVAALQYIEKVAKLRDWQLEAPKKARKKKAKADDVPLESFILPPMPSSDTTEHLTTASEIQA
jgi:hypothetical protein